MRECLEKVIRKYIEWKATKSEKASVPKIMKVEIYMHIIHFFNSHFYSVQRNLFFKSIFAILKHK